MTAAEPVALRHLTQCLDGRRIPLNSTERHDIPGEIPYWGSGGVVGTVGDYLFDERLVLLGEDGAPFYDMNRDVAFKVSGKTWVNNHIHVLRPNADVDHAYLTYALNAVDYSLYISGSTRDKLTQEDMRRILVPMWPLERQRQISLFLDRETAQIDELIGKQEQLIALLGERRRATIDEAYAREATPAKLRHVVQFAQTGPFGTQLSAEEYVEDGVPVINPTHIRNGEITPDTTVSVTPGKASELARHRLLKGDIILGRKGEVDKSARATHDSEGFVCGSDSMLLRPKTSTDSDYLWWFFQSPKAHAQLELWSVGSTVAGLNQTTMSKIRLPLPSLEEQRVVARLLSDATSKIDGLIAKAAEFVVLLRERRTALISAAVTGKIDITTRGVAA